MLLVPVWAYFVLGYLEALGRASPGALGTIALPWVSLHWVWAFPPRAGLVLFAFSLLMGAVHIVNQISDLETDRKNPGFPLLARGIVGLRPAIGMTGAMIAAAAAFSWILGLEYGILFSAAIALGFLYSMKPFRWSGVPVLDFLSNAVGYGLITFGLGWCAAGGGFSTQALFAGLPYFFLMIAGSVASTVPDLPGDVADGKITTAVRFGIRNTAFIGLAALTAAILFAWWLRSPIAVFVGFLSIPFFARLAQRPVRENGYAAYQVGGGVLVLIALLLCAPLLLISIAVFFLTRLYFWKAHRVRYPQAGH